MNARNRGKFGGMGRSDLFERAAANEAMLIALVSVLPGKRLTITREQMEASAGGMLALGKNPDTGTVTLTYLTKNDEPQEEGNIDASA